MTVRLLIRPRRNGAFAQLRLFLAAYVLYNLGRYAAVGDLNTASDHARWIVDVERGLGVSVERSVQGALNTGILPWLMSHVYLAAQLVVLPGTLIWVYRRSPGVYRSLGTPCSRRGCSRCRSTPSTRSRRRARRASA